MPYCIAINWRLPQEPSEIMPAVRQKGQGFCPNDRIERQGCIEVRKKRAATRSLKSERFTQPVFIRRNENQAVLASKIFCGGLADLFGGREVDKGAGKFGLCPTEEAGFFRIAPE
jgi:hypothetical protein